MWEEKAKFWNDPIGDLLNYDYEPRSRASKIVAIEHNDKAFDLNFILNSAFMYKWKLEIITNGLKIRSRIIKHLEFLDSVSFLPCALFKLSEAFAFRLINHCTRTN